MANPNYNRPGNQPPPNVGYPVYPQGYSPQQPGPGGYTHGTYVAVPQSNQYPPNYPPQAYYQGYPPPPSQGVYPGQAYIPQGYPQGAYPPMGYPQQAGYPPGTYPPMPAYPPQAGYPNLPQHPPASYPPASYPPSYNPSLGNPPAAPYGNQYQAPYPNYAPPQNYYQNQPYPPQGYQYPPNEKPQDLAYVNLPNPNNPGVEGLENKYPQGNAITSNPSEVPQNIPVNYVNNAPQGKVDEVPKPPEEYKGGYSPYPTGEPLVQPEIAKEIATDKVGVQNPAVLVNDPLAPPKEGGDVYAYPPQSNPEAYRPDYIPAAVVENKLEPVPVYSDFKAVDEVQEITVSTELISITGQPEKQNEPIKTEEEVKEKIVTEVPNVEHTPLPTSQSAPEEIVREKKLVSEEFKAEEIQSANINTESEPLVKDFPATEPLIKNPDFKPEYISAEFEIIQKSPDEANSHKFTSEF